MNGPLLIYHMRTHGDTMKSLGQFLGLAYGTVSDKIWGRATFSLREARAISERYGFTPEEVHRVFFEDVPLTKTTKTENEK